MRTRLVTVVVAGLTAAAALAACSSGGSAPSGTLTGTSAPTPATSPAGPGTTTAPVNGATGTTTSAPAATTGPTAARVPLVPLWPFTTTAQAAAWQQAYRSGGHQPWHLDVGQTALSFVRGHLGYTDIDRVTSQAVNGADARVGVGWTDAETGRRTVGVLHLIRLGTGQDAPWVVVGSDDTTLTLDAPVYGATVSSPLRIGGVISGVDEALHVVVLGPASSVPLATVAGLPAGGERTPWSTTLRFTAPSGTVLTVAVSTGGHVKGVERFAVTAVRVR